MIFGADPSAFPNSSTRGKLIDARRWSLVIIPLKVSPPFAARDTVGTPRQNPMAMFVSLGFSPMSKHREFTGRWNRPAHFFFGSFDLRGHYREFFSVAGPCFGDLTPQIDPPSFKQ